MITSKLSWRSWVCGIVAFKNEIQLHFPILILTLDKEQIRLEDELKNDVEAHLRFLKQEFERYFPDLGDTELPEWKMTTGNLFVLTRTFFPTICKRNSWK